jgi:protein SCO1
MEAAEADDIGPSLAGITQKRDRKWLQRWLKAPDAMIKAKDPIALAIFKQYREIYMPNLKLSDGEIESLLQFMAQPNR